MKISHSLFMVFLACSFPAFSTLAQSLNGQEVGNGGGVICISGECKTLTEAGLKLVPEFQGVWIPDVSHYTDVNDILAQTVSLPNSTKDLFKQRIFGRVDHFRKVDVIDDAKLESIRKYYLEVAEAAGFKIDPSTFQVVAFSSDDTATPALTFLLPSFFKLTPLQQAKFLLHEGLYRGRKTSDLKYVLQFESTIDTISKQGSNSEAGRRARVDQNILAYRLGIWNKSDMIGGLLQTVFADTNSSNFQHHLGKLVVEGANAYLDVDHGALIKFAPLEPRLPYMFSRVDRIQLKFQREIRLQRFTNLIFNPDWSLPTMFSECDLTPTGGKAYDCKGYSFVDVEQVDIILPE